MRKIDKSNIHSSALRDWEASLVKNGHDSYSSSHPQYLNTLVSLLICQGGLCAYTEIKILGKAELAGLISLFNTTGNYTGARIKYPVDIEHFDSSLKSDGNAWKFSNLFAVDRFINQTIKRKEEAIYGVDDILKPDSLKYDPFHLLEFDEDNNMFIPNTKVGLTKKQEDRIMKMLLVLGINCGYTKTRRKDYLRPLLELEKFKSKTYKPEQFVTAYEMIKTK